MIQRWGRRGEGAVPPPFDETPSERAPGRWVKGRPRGDPEETRGSPEVPQAPGAPGLRIPGPPRRRNGSREAARPPASPPAPLPLLPRSSPAPRRNPLPGGGAHAPAGPSSFQSIASPGLGFEENLNPRPCWLACTAFKSWRGDDSLFKMTITYCASGRWVIRAPVRSGF